MAAVYGQNLGEGSGMLVDRDKRGATEGGSYKENTPHGSLRKTSKSNPRTPLPNGTNGLYSRSAGSIGEADGYNYDSIAQPESSRRDYSQGQYRPDVTDADYEKWIHRDKLAKIESEEMQAMGFLPEAGQRSSKSRRTQSRDRLTEVSSRQGQHEEWTPQEDQAAQSSPRFEDPDPIDPDGWDLRTPEEIAAESTPLGRPFNYPMVRKSGSRIPVLTSSPLPIPSERQERETPLPRKRTFSGSIRDDDLTGSPSRTRTRGSSAGSQNLLDDLDFRPGSRSADGTPVTRSSKSPFQTTSPPSGRKVTPSTKKTHKPRVPSNSNSPSTRSTDPDRPRTAVNRPEGEAPWIATMFKPDPRLPPDQQILPTHAKKQQALLQQQQEAEAEERQRYQPSHSPHTPSPTLQPHKTSTEVNEDPSTWAYRPPRLRSPTSPNSKDGRPETAGSATGGYSTMPRVQGSFSSQGGMGPASGQPQSGPGGRNESFSMGTGAPGVNGGTTTGQAQGYSSVGVLGEGQTTTSVSASGTRLDAAGPEKARPGRDLEKQDGGGKESKGCACCVVM